MYTSCTIRVVQFYASELGARMSPFRCGAMDPDAMTTDQLRRWAEAMSTVGLQQLIQVAREELQARADNAPHSWNAPGQIVACLLRKAPHRLPDVLTKVLRGHHSRLHRHPRFLLNVLSARFRCGNPAYHRRCKRAGNHRNHFCRPCHDAGWG